MEPLSQRARDALSAYRREHGLSPGQHERLLAGLVARIDAVEPKPEASQRPDAVAAAARLSSPKLVGVLALSVAITAITTTLLMSERPSALSVPTAHAPSVQAANPIVVPPAGKVAPVAAAQPEPASRGPSAQPASKRANLALNRRKRQPSSASGQRVAAALREPGGHAGADDPAATSGAEPVPIQPDQAATREPLAASAPAAPTCAESELATQGPVAHAASEQSAGATSVLDGSERVQRRAPRKEGSLDEEVFSLRRAHALALSGEQLRALSALDEHVRRFPAGKLSEAAQVARITALCELGRSEPARAQARQFLQRYPASLYAARVRRVCAGH